ncbi:type II and III secretion system protein family protein [Novosphingobium rosa]|uniref:type II and III secretion system protein family protein n=1 Tax=Novosphingobium rosa TaxID=76978 RepID=UPI000831DA30|nr:type II and III secretion system protein family protein [Novosphingobium rosa]
MKNRFLSLLLSAGAISALSLGVAGTAQAAPRKAHHPVRKAAAPAVHVGTRAPDYGVPASGTISNPTGQIVLSIGRGQLVNLPGTMKDVFIADDKIADLQVKSNHQLYLYGKSSGETTIYASNAEGRVVWSANIRVGNNIDNVDQMLRVAMPEAHIATSTVGASSVLLTGTVAAPEDAAEATRLVQAFMGKDANIISRLRTATPLQVSLHVRIAEVSRTLTRTIGTNLTGASSSTNGVQFGISRGDNQGTITNPQGYLSSGLASGTYTRAPTVYNFPGNLTGSTAISLGTKFLGLSLLSSLDLGESIGLVTTLAEPNLTALSGETSTFLAGGEYPIPMSSGLGTVSVEFKNYGVSLAYTPTVLSDGRISLRVRPEVSELSSQGAVSFGGYSVPALTIRRAETTVELGSGQSMMIAGLLSNNAQHTITKLPGAGDLPVLGSLFKSTNFQRGESELVIVITPYLVKPVNAADIKLPTDGLQNPTTTQEVLGNMLTDGKSGAARPGPTSGDNGLPPRVGLGAPAQQAPGAAPAAAQTYADPAPAPLTKRQAKAAAKAAKQAQQASNAAPAPSPKGDAQAPGFSLN